jgi:molybdopterin-guanine dinucleotide biosynthesis protein A
MKVAAVIVAGGRSSRMGREKALIEIAGKPILQWIIERIAPQVSAMAINANSDGLAAFGLPLIADIRRDIGTPLAGIHAALHWTKAQGFDAVLTVPSDSPFLPRDLVARLGEGPAIAASRGQEHFLTGLWPVALYAKLESALPAVRRVQDWAHLCNARVTDLDDLPHDPFFNINTLEDLVEAECIAAEFRP